MQWHLCIVSSDGFSRQKYHIYQIRTWMPDPCQIISYFVWYTKIYFSFQPESLAEKAREQQKQETGDLLNNFFYVCFNAQILSDQYKSKKCYYTTAWKQWNITATQHRPVALKNLKWRHSLISNLWRQISLETTQS